MSEKEGEQAGFVRLRSKYRNIPIMVDGLRFSSKAEARRYGELKILQAAGEVFWFMLQPRFRLPGGIVYVADFLVVWGSALSPRFRAITVEDVKGHETQAFKLKRKLFEAQYGPLTVIRYGHKRASREDEYANQTPPAGHGHARTGTRARKNKAAKRPGAP